MNEVPNIDLTLWFTLKSDPESKCYLHHNPHTFPGRMGAWGMSHQGRNAFFCVSSYEIADCSTEARYWIKGFLAGNEPGPPLDIHDEPLPDDSLTVQQWRKATALFRETGQWSVTERVCEVCQHIMLPSELPGFCCSKCKGI